MWNRGPIGGPFALIDHTGKLRTDEDFRGKLLLIYFGYSYCPDVCPTDLQQIGLALEQLGAASEAVQPLFITLDPARDTPDVLKKWTDAFDPHLIGLTGTVPQIDAVAKQFAVYFKREQPNKDGAYLVDHARMALLMGPKGEPIALIPQDKDAQAVAAELDRWVR